MNKLCCRAVNWSEWVSNEPSVARKTCRAAPRLALASITLAMVRSCFAKLLVRGPANAAASDESVVDRMGLSVAALATQRLGHHGLSRLGQAVILVDLEQLHRTRHDVR